jgi:NDP-sugar pyrophosphorylase family protein
MAAGEGTRLRPLTETWAKAVLPIDGRPVIATLLRELADAGIERVVVVTGHLAEQVEELVGDGAAFGLRAEFVRQPGVLGSADTVQRAVAAGLEPPFLVCAADTVFQPGDIRRFAGAVDGWAGGIAVRREPAPDPPHRVATRVVDGRVVSVLDRDPATPTSGAPLWAFGPELVPFLCLDRPPHELGLAYERGLEAGLSIAGVDVGTTRDLTHPVDLVRENFPYASVFGGS